MAQNTEGPPRLSTLLRKLRISNPDEERDSGSSEEGSDVEVVDELEGLSCCKANSGELVDNR